MNASDSILLINSPHYTTAFSNPISQFIVPLISGMPESSLIFLERLLVVSYCGHINS